ncbi:uncharacterized protein LOC141819318 isoform X1 [Curcuma longa]|uniref:uncharacterized protein LOC141819318 isoform X1 n=1 Tax=Curcuma longa TaxID=136217 RepID=UPI003D9DE973
MGSDFVSDGAVALSRDMTKKKKTHRSAKLKQCKLDARREQWLSQGLCSRSAVKDKDCVVSEKRSPAASPPLRPVLYKKMDLGLKEEEVEIRVSPDRDGSNSHDSEGGSPTRGGTIDGCPANSISSGSSFASSLRSLSDAEVEGDDHVERGEEGVDDWETLADELGDDGSQPDPNPVDTAPDSSAVPGHTNKDTQESLEKPEVKQAVSRAWRPDDTLRPQSLPNLLKQRSFPVSMARRYAASGWSQRDILSAPSSCPICCEDLDSTDSSFLPCNCGFRLCLFCHKRILEADGRCPGCRKHYAPVASGEVGIMDGIPSLALHLSRSCSMSSRT